MKNALIILNDPPYGTERSFNGLRIADALHENGTNVKIFLIGDAASCAKAGQNVPEGYYNLEIMLRRVARRNGAVGVCGSCMDARGISEDELISGSHRSTMEELAEWIEEVDQTLEF